MAISKLDASEITTAQADLSSGKLTTSHVEDVHSIFRSFLGKKLSASYSLLSTLENADDSDGSTKCAKLVACLNRLNEAGFDVGGFSATSSNRTGLTFSILESNLEIVKYMFGLFWDIPDEIENRYNRNSRSSRGSGVIDIRQNWR